MDASQIKEHMDVVGSDDQHVGTLDRVEGQRISLTRKDASSSGEHRFVDVCKVSEAKDEKIRLSCTAPQANQQ